MAVTQISRIQVRRGSKDALPQSLEEGEFGLALDTGELFVGAPNLAKLDYRTSVFPYHNVRVLTEFDVVHTLHDHIVTTGPLQRIESPSRASSTQNTWAFSYQGDPSTDLVRLLDSVSGENPGDLRGRVIIGAQIDYGNGNTGTVGTSAFTVVHVAGPLTPNSRLQVDAAELNMSTFPSATFRITFLNVDTVARWPLLESDSFVMNYSMKSTEANVGIPVRRVGQLMIVADDYSVQLVDSGVDMNQDPDANNYMRIVFSGHIETEADDSKTVVLTCTNTSYQSISITFSGDRWAHSSED